MPKASTSPRFFKRSGHDLTVKDSQGVRHLATLGKLDEQTTRDDGAFAFGYCKSCDWTGPGRRARDKARKDALTHQDECPSKGKIRIGMSESDPR